MRHNVFGRKFGRSKDERKLLFRNLVSELILRGRVKTTVAKAKAVKPLIDKLVVKAKNAALGKRREIFRVLPKEASLVLVDTIGPQFKDRTSGFSRIIHLGGRAGDNAQLVILEWTDRIDVSRGETKKTEQIEGVKEKKIPKKVARKRRVVKKA